MSKESHSQRRNKAAVINVGEMMLSQVYRWGYDTENEVSAAAYPFPEDFTETVWQHTLHGMNDIAIPILKHYRPIKESMDLSIFYPMFWQHDLHEWKHGDVTVAQKSRMVADQTRNLAEKEASAFLEIIDLCNMGRQKDQMLKKYHAFENWKTTKEYPVEAAFARFIDTYSGTETLIKHKYGRGGLARVMYDTRDEMEILREDVKKSSERVFQPLQRLYELYEGKNGRENSKTEALTSLTMDVLDHLIQFFKRYNFEAEFHVIKAIKKDYPAFYQYLLNRYHSNDPAYMSALQYAESGIEDLPYYLWTLSNK